MKQRTEFLDKMKENLLIKRQELEDLLRQIAEEGESDGQIKDSADEAYSLSMSKLQNSLQDAEINEIKLINDALERIEHGEYGICIHCSEPINVKRLEIFPYAARCIACQESLEE